MEVTTATATIIAANVIITLFKALYGHPLNNPVMLLLLAPFYWVEH